MLIMYNQFSIIIPCYNSEKYVIDCLKSLTEQTYKLFEIILIDDGSVDSTYSVMYEYLKNVDIDFKIIRIENTGVSFARNIGLDNAKHDNLVFVDSDDIVSPYLLQILNDAMQDDDYDSISFKTTNEIKKVFRNKINYKSRKISSDVLFDQFTYNKSVFHFLNFTYKKTLLQKYNISFDVKTTHGEDTEFTSKYLSYCSNGKFIDENLYFYRIVSNSASRTINYNQTTAINAAVRLKEYFKQNNPKFYDKVNNYVVPKVTFSCLRRFSASNNRDLFNRMIGQYDVNSELKKLILHKKAHLTTKMGSLIFIISKKLFFSINRMRGNK